MRILNNMITLDLNMCEWLSQNQSGLIARRKKHFAIRECGF